MPYLPKKSAGWQVQIRLPVTLDPTSRLSLIRLTIAAMPAIEPGRKAIFMVSAVQDAIAEVEHLDHREPGAARGEAREGTNVVAPC